MEVDLYDGDLPAVDKTWVDLFQENKEALTIAVKIVAVPTTMFVVTCVFNYYINKRWTTL